MADKLFPCPFCGREAEQDFQQAYRAMQDGRVDHGAAVYCTGCNANMIMCRGDHPELSDEERMAVVVEDWNRRTPPPSTHLRMKPLEWNAIGEGAFLRTTAQTPFGLYTIMPDFTVHFIDEHVASCGDIEGAKASAFADYLARMMSAIEPPPVMREAVR